MDSFWRAADGRGRLRRSMLACGVLGVIGLIVASRLLGNRENTMQVGKWRQPRNWAGIKTGVTVQEVHEKLGDPHKILCETIDGHEMLDWYYGPFPAGGQVEFSDGRVWNWIIPDWRRLAIEVDELDGYQGTGH